MISFVRGQRWISGSEPELGLGTIMDIADGRVTVLFPASGETRLYAAENAPLKRVRFKPGNTVKSHDGQSLVVKSVREAGGLLTYVGDSGELAETLLCDSISFNSPEDRLASGHFDDPDAFALRVRTLEHLHASRKSLVRGFVGGSIDLIPHQFYIAHEVSSRHAPRVLLSDEVGLGKTIEACLILHRLLLSGRASRILILVPDSLVHQWFVEMLRKFNLWFHIFDEERCASIEAGQPGANPFLDDQLVLSSINYLAAAPIRAAQAVEAEWDVLVVDEAHHLEWATDNVSSEYALVEALGRRAEGLLLLTATPEQLGPESHFARLRLLDPDRHEDFSSFQHEGGDFRAVADIADKLSLGKAPAANDVKLLKQWFKHDPASLESKLAALKAGDASAGPDLLNDLLDLHGPARVLFRNTRAAMSGFPKRVFRPAPITARTDHDEWIDAVSTEFAVDAGDSTLEIDFELARDPRVEWLTNLLQELAPQKVLLICRSVDKVIALEDAIASRLQIKTAAFHENLTLVQRDRHAAWFASEEGARLLICSEIGSEGRNFQFAQHLVLFDLPLNPELLEQRIGRLDRIGQKHDIQIHVPYLTGSPQEVLSRWYHEGLNAFETNLEGGNQLLHQFGRQVHDLALEFPVEERAKAEAELRELIGRTAAAREELVQKLEQGRDRLLEMNSFRPKVAKQLVDAVRQTDGEDTLEEYMLDVFEHFGVHAEELARRTFHLNAQGVTTDAFPSIPEEGLTATLERQRAVSREDVALLSWDHPMVAGSMDLILGSEKGNSSFAWWPGEDRILLLEAVFVLEAIAPPKLHVDRFLPPTPLRVVMNHKPADVTAQHPAAALAKVVKKQRAPALLDNPDITGRIVPNMLTKAQESAEAQAAALIADSRSEMEHLLGRELQRLKYLEKANHHVRPAEISLAEEHLQKLGEALQNARLRLDCARLIWKGPIQ